MREPPHVDPAAPIIDSERARTTNPYPYPYRGPMWLIGVSLALIATCLILRLDGYSSPAHAQPAGQAGARGIFAFTGQLSKNSYGLFMVDVDTMTVWCYEYLSDSNSLRLVAGRSWMYDRYLQDLNTEPSTDQIERLVQEAREARMRNRGKP